MKVIRAIKNDADFIAAMLVMGFIAGAGYAAIRAPNFLLLAAWYGGIAGFSVAFVCAIMELVVFSHFTRLPFSALLFIKTITYAVVGISVVYLNYIFWGDGGAATSFFVDPKRLLVTIIITLTISYLANLFLAMRRVLGKHVFQWLLVGRYRRPVEELRMFMFIDLVSSTVLAEKIGHVKYHQLIHKFWCDIADEILRSHGDIYKYVGDEVIITWLLVESKPDNCWFECFFWIRDIIRQRSDEYLR